MSLSITDIAIKYPLIKDCLALDKQLEMMRQDMFYHYSILDVETGNLLKIIIKQKEEMYNVLGCKKAISDKLISETKAIADKYSSIAKTRITSDNNSMRIVYLSIGTITLLASTYFIIKYLKK